MNPDRISVPKVAGISRPEDLLAPERAEVLKHYDQILLPKHRLPAEPPLSCVGGAPIDDKSIRALFMRHGEEPRGQGPPPVRGDLGRRASHHHAGGKKPLSKRRLITLGDPMATVRKLGW